MRGAPRRGFTLVEVAVFSGIALLVVAGAWSLFHSSMTKGKRTDTKLQGVQGSLLLALTLERDLAMLHHDPEHRIRHLVTKEGMDLEFHRYGPQSAEDTWEPLPLDPVRYRFRADTGKVVRDVAGSPPELLHGSFERITVRVADRLEGKTDDLLPEAPAVVFSAVGVPPELLDRPEGERPGSARTVVVGAVPRVGVARREAYPEWNAVPYGPSRK